MMKKNQNSTETEKIFRSKGFRQKMVDRTDESYDRKIALVRARYVERWNELCGGQYTTDHPVVKVEWELCDLINQRLLMKGKRQEFFEMAKLNDEEISVYLNGLDVNGVPYTYIESTSLKKETGRAIKMLVKKQL